MQQPETMSISRRDFLKLVGIFTAGTAAGCSPLAQYFPEPKQENLPALSRNAWQALNRLTLGPTQHEVKQVAAIGMTAWLEEQLAPRSIPDPKTSLLVSRIDILDRSADDLRAMADGLFDNVDKNVVVDEFRQATLLRMVYSRRQLYEVMVEFWSDHFNISIQKGDCWYLKPVDDREVIRKHALGSFRDLLGASVHSPAMLVYLDNQANHRDAPNENYARELLELHTLGVNGGYTQRDVMELARCLTGWTVKDHFWRGEIQFDPNVHDHGQKQVLGLAIGPAGKKEIDRVVDQLSVHPATARTISTKLARRFVADDPPPGLVDRAAGAFLQSKGDIRATLRVIILDGLQNPEKEWIQPKYKRPVNYVVSALRQTGADTNAGLPLQRYLKEMGQPLFAWPTPDGYPDHYQAWQGNLLPRWKFALDLAQNQIPGTRLGQEPFTVTETGNSRELLARISQPLLGRALSSELQDNLNPVLEPILNNHPQEAGTLALAALIASPAFQWR